MKCVHVGKDGMVPEQRFSVPVVSLIVRMFRISNVSFSDAIFSVTD